VGNHCDIVIGVAHLAKIVILKKVSAVWVQVSGASSEVFGKFDCLRQRWGPDLIFLDTDCIYVGPEAHGSTLILLQF
jgi:hypothetical protein